MAGEALGLTLNVYSKNITLSTGATPTPHWVGFTVYHVERDLARGLYLQNVAKRSAASREDRDRDSRRHQ